MKSKNPGIIDVIKNIIEYKGDKEYTLEELMSEINYKIKDYGYQLLSLDPNNVKLITFTPDAKIDVFLKPVDINTELSFINFFYNNGVYIDKKVLKDIFERLEAYKFVEGVGKVQGKKEILENIKNDYDINFNVYYQNTTKIKGSGVFDIVSMGLTTASYLFSFDGTNAETITDRMMRTFPFLGRRTNGYDFLISFTNNIIGSIERGFKSKEMHAYEIKTMIAGSENHDKYIFLEHDGSEISTNKLLYEKIIESEHSCDFLESKI
jgi:hypothetical protein